MNKDIESLKGDAERLAGSASIFTHPDAVLHSRLSVAEKRRILAAWASDAQAVPNLPAMRQLDSGAIVAVDTVLTALRALDGARVAAAPGRLGWTGRPRRCRDPRWFLPLGRRRSDDDDDPPPCPATALPPGVAFELRRHGDADLHLAAA